MTIQLELIEDIEVGNVLGESVTWDPRNQSVWWTDIMTNKIYQYFLDKQCLNVFDVPERACSLGLTKDINQLIIAFETGIGLFSPLLNSVSKRNTIDWKYRPFKVGCGIRFNDGRIDNQGRFWISTMIEDEQISTNEAKLISLDGESRVKSHLSHFKVGNSLAWNESSKKMYFSDSSAHQIWSFDFNFVNCSISNKACFANTPDDCFPDGAEVESNGDLWCTNWGGSSITVYSENEKNKHNISLPVSQPTCLTFGGQERKLLFVTSATYNKSKKELLAEPSAGNLLIYRTNTIGLPSNVWGVSRNG